MPQANTGQNDSRSLWGSNLLSTIEKGANTLGAFRNLFRPQQAAAPAPAPAAAPASSEWKQYLPWIIGGAVALVAFVFLLKKR